MESHELQDETEAEFDIDVELPPDFEAPFADDADVLDLGPILVI